MRQCAMWMLGLAGGALVVALAFWKRMTRKGRTRGIDVGPVSDAWLAEQRARGRESPY